MNFNNQCLLTFLIVSLTTIGVLSAKHIVGGYTSYQHISGNTYSISIDVYRDCDSDGAPFDFRIPVGVFTRPEGSSNYVRSDVETVDFGVSSRIPVNRRPCISYPADTCIEQGNYELLYDLTPGLDYIFAYQRCCRNDGQRNIIYEDCGVGSTFYVEITNEARRLRNSSPVFNQFPPIVICRGFELNYDHSARDVDGDSLVYSFCAPASGGGNGGVDPNCGTANSLTGTVPNPPATPPYESINYTAGYSGAQPISGNPPLRINRESGLITGTPDQVGLYSVGVCIDEYREGELIGEYTRDFQFFVSECTFNVNAFVENDFVRDDGVFVINRCGEKNVSIDNLSTERSEIFDVEWLLNYDGDAQIVDQNDFYYEFDDYSSYNIQLFLNKASVCADTADILLNLYPGLQADFIYRMDSCRISSVEFTDLSTVEEANEIVSHEWDFGDGTNGVLPDLEHLYALPGAYPVTLRIEDRNGCESIISQEVRYYPNPELVIVSPNITRGCVPQSVFYDNLSEPINEDYTVVWDFGDGSIDTGLSPTHIYENPGEYTVGVEITSPIGCSINRTFQRLVNINPSPFADFDYSPKELDRFNRNVGFTEQSRDFVDLLWDFGFGATSRMDNPSIVFPDSGIFQVSLIVRNEFRCYDTAQAIIDVYPTVTHFLPNAFSPNADGTNDRYRAQGVFTGIQNYEFNIYDRYGQKVFYSEDPSVGWNGININNGKESPPGGYMIHGHLTDGRGKVIHFKQMFTLFK